MAKTALALVNTAPSLHFSETHPDLTIVNKAQRVNEPAIYHPENKEKALKDLERHEKRGRDHIAIKKITIEDTKEEGGVSE